MKKIRRWLLLFAVIITLMVRVDGLKATSLIFGRGPATSSTTTTTSTTTVATSTSEDSAEAEDVVVEQSDDAVTKAPLTGIPQIDYVWDPNLPRELRGFNLSNYPFLDSVPLAEDIGFTCDPKLHDGFYASIKYNCQLYHHCINGMRYDFLCANYTAFDQKTFICHFASEVDCKNSPKYWFRNDQLYKATTTTTVKPPPTTSTTAAPTTVPSRPKPLRKPVRRRRPQVDYYYDDDEYEDDYYEERNRRRKNRPRNRRPIYDDYEEDERFERVRPMGGDRYRERDRDETEDEYEERRPYRMKTRNRNTERRPAVAAEDDRRYYDDRRRDRDRRPVADDRRPVADDRRRPAVVEEEEKRPVVANERRRVPAADRERRPSSERRSVAGNGDDRRSFSADAESRRGALADDRRPLKRPLYDDRRYQDEEDDEFDGSAAPSYGGRRAADRGRQQAQNDVVTVKPSGSSIYDRPRAAPRINRPVPLKEKNKYAYGSDGPDPKDTGTSSRTSSTAAAEPEYYDEYEDLDEEPAPREALGSGGDKRKGDDAAVTSERLRPTDYGSVGGGAGRKPPRPSASSDVVYYDDVIVAKDDIPFRSVPGNVRKPEQTERINSRDNSELATGANRYTDKSRGSTKHQPSPMQLRQFSLPKVSTAPPVSHDTEADDVVEDDDDYDVPAPRPSVIARPAANLYANFKNKKQPQQQQSPPPAPPPQQQQLSNAEGISSRLPGRPTKRPFLPSRGGNPYLARGLQPVGVAKQPAKTSNTASEPEKPAPFRIDLDSSTTSAPGGKRNQQTPAQQQQPEVVNVKTLDQLYDDEFDVTLNDALNPTLKPLTRSAPQSFFRNRYVHQPDTEFVPFEPSYAPSEFRRTAVRPPPVLYHASPAAVAIDAAPQQRQRYDAYAAYEY